MAFPVVQATNESATTTAGTSHVINLPSGIAAGDLLLVMLGKGSTSATINALAGWTELLDENIARGGYVAYRWADGTEGASITLTSSASTKSASVSYRISGAENPSTQAPQISAVLTGTSNAPDANSLSPTGGAKDYLWLTFFILGGAGEELDDDTWCNNAATNYASLLQKTSGTAGTNIGAYIASSQRTNNAASENAVWPAGTTDQSLSWRAFTLAVHPAAAQAALFEAAVSAAATVAAAITTAIEMAGALVGSAVVAAALTTDITPAASILGSAEVAGALTTEITASASVSGTATVAADLTVSEPALLEVSVSGSATLVGSITTEINAVASVSGNAVVVGDLTTEITVASSVSGSATIAGDLTAAGGAAPLNYGGSYYSQGNYRNHGMYGYG